VSVNSGVVDDHCQQARASRPRHCD
jgi:hypothetical protein